MDHLDQKRCLRPARVRRRVIVLGASVCLGAAVAPACLGQTPPNAGSLLEQNKNFGRSNVEAPRSEVLEAPVRPVIKLPAGATVAVSRFQIVGATSFPADALMPLVTPWAGRTLDINGLNEAAGAVTRYYQNHGHFLAYAYLPAQKVDGGVVEIQVLEGRVAGVEVASAPDVRLRDEVVQDHVGQVAQAPTVLQADLERRLLLLNDIPGVVARAAFTPADTPGRADMVVSVAEEEPLVVRVDADNEGSTTTGRYRVGVNFDFRDLFGVGDSTQARLIMSDTVHMVDSSLTTSVPVGGQGLSLGGGLSRLTYQLGGSFVALGGVGTALVETVNLGYPLVRSLERNLNLLLSYDHKGLDDQIVLTGADTPKIANVFGAKLAYDAHDGWLGGGSLGAAVTLSQGFLSIGGAALAQDRAGAQTEGSYSKLAYDLWRQQSIRGPVFLFVHVQGQHASKNLDSSEKFDLGGPNAVRGYAVGEATLDDAAYLGLELRCSTSYVGGSVTWFVFHDHGWGRFNAQALTGGADNRVVLYANGVGAQWLRGNSFGVNASVALRGTRLPTAAGGDPQPRAYLQVFQMY